MVKEKPWDQIMLVYCKEPLEIETKREDHPEGDHLGGAPKGGPLGGGPPKGDPLAGGPPGGGDPDDKNCQPRLQTGKISSHIDIFNGDRAKAKKFQMEFGLAQMTNLNHQNMRVPMQQVALTLSYSGSKNCSNVWLFYKDWPWTNLKKIANNLKIIFVIV